MAPNTYNYLNLFVKTRYYIYVQCICKKSYVKYIWISNIITQTNHNILTSQANSSLFTVKASLLGGDLTNPLPLPCPHGLWMPQKEEKGFVYFNLFTTKIPPNSYSGNLFWLQKNNCLDLQYDSFSRIICQNKSSIISYF